MYSWKEIQAMNDAQIHGANKKLMTRLVLTRIVLPIAATAAAIVVMNKLEKSDPIED
jgi:hypothetical protein